MSVVEYGRAICWIRRDLRLYDHTAMAKATELAEDVVVVFVYDKAILDELPTREDRRVTFIHESLAEVDEGLRGLGSRLLTVYGDAGVEIPRLAKELGVDVVVTARDDDPYALERDAAVGESLKGQGVGFVTVLDHVVKERRSVLSQAGEPMRVFTPYSRAWREAVVATDFEERVPDFGKLVKAEDLPDGLVGNRELESMGFVRTELWLEPGERAARERLEKFGEKVARYGNDRNFPGVEGTSGLSVHLRFGTVSIRDCFRHALAWQSAGAKKWETELIWREFYHMILSEFPWVGEGVAFKKDLNDLAWPGGDAEFEAWKAGMTGYPLVDAAMRCFAATGWMHNRLRMVVAMFLTKDLLVDWRRGEKYFADYLLDFELASNNGGWQWSASTGVDAQPYFRIFNPVLQSQKFDPEGSFIKEWCPELRELSGKFLHWPFAEDGSRTLETPGEYPSPVVLHKDQRVKAIALFKEQR